MTQTSPGGDRDGRAAHQLEGQKTRLRLEHSDAARSLPHALPSASNQSDTVAVVAGVGPARCQGTAWLLASPSHPQVLA